MRNPLGRRMKALEERVEVNGELRYRNLSDAELCRELAIRDPVTGEIRTDLSDDELEEMVRGHLRDLGHAA